MKKIVFFVILIFIVSIGIFFVFVPRGVPDNINEPQATSLGPRIEYYTCGMHPSVRVSPEEYKRGKTNCPICNMGLVPVYKEEATGPEVEGAVGIVRLKGEQVALAGIETVPVRKLHLFKEVRAVGRIAYDPKLAVAQEEYLSALEALDRISQGQVEEITRRARELVESSARKLKLLGMSQEQIMELQNSRKLQTNLILPERKVWVYADIYEFELVWVKEGQQVLVTTYAFPGEEFKGKVVSINPTLDPKTRSVRIRSEIENPDMKLKPDMYVDVVIESMYISPGGSHKVLAVPREAVLDTGLRKIVWVDLGNGKFQGREVKTGPEATTEIDGSLKRYLPILSGLKEEEKVVARGNFLIDSQSQLTGGAAAAYGGALEAEEGAVPPAKHQH